MSEQPKTSSDASVESDHGEEQPKQTVVRYGRMMHLGVFRHDLPRPPAPGRMLVVQTDRGTELGTVVINVAAGEGRWSIKPESLEQYITASGPDYPFSRTGRVLRPANAQDINDQHHLDGSTKDEADFCRRQISQLELQMRIVAVEHLLGGERIVFFFTAEHRVDFRELVRRLASQYHTRIEMRQIGARDEARLVADYERCGRRCCCQEYLKLLRPISMRMAKTQKATLDPAKISGRCGRLLCCLRYEDATYEELQRGLPKKKTWVRTADGVVGKVLEVQILTQLVRLILANGSQTVVPNEEIHERDIPAPPAEPEKGAEEIRPPTVRRRRTKPEGEPATRPVEAPPNEVSVEAEPQHAPADRPAQQPQDRKGRRRKPRRGRGKKPKHPAALSAAPQVSSQSAKPPADPDKPQQAEQSAGQQNKKEHRRRKRRG